MLNTELVLHQFIMSHYMNYRLVLTPATANNNRPISIMVIICVPWPSSGYIQLVSIVKNPNAELATWFRKEWSVLVCQGQGMVLKYGSFCFIRLSVITYLYYIKRQGWMMNIPANTDLPDKTIFAQTSQRLILETGDSRVMSSIWIPLTWWGNKSCWYCIYRCKDTQGGQHFARLKDLTSFRTGVLHV